VRANYEAELEKMFRAFGARQRQIGMVEGLIDFCAAKGFIAVKLDEEKPQ
jgi:hypothetical protein